MELETDRLLLRPIDPERDFEAWARTMADPNTVKYLGTEPMDRSAAWRHMALLIGHWSILGYGFFSVINKQTNDWVGRVGPWNPEGWPEPEVGWTISPDHRGNGFASEAAVAAIRFVFETLKWPRVAHCIFQGNEPSVGVAKKVGSKLLRTQQGIAGVTDRPVWIYGQEAGPQ